MQEEWWTELTKGAFDWVICNAGSAAPGFISEQRGSEAEWMMKCNYLSALYVVRSVIQLSSELSDSRPEATESEDNSEKTVIASDVSKCIAGIPVRSRLPSRIIFVGSVMSLLSFIGFTGYAARYTIF
jgi:NAD(P)-dependent dehydrogenase (short-subunit alcohol dehydrogenase family)